MFESLMIMSPTLYWSVRPLTTCTSAFFSLSNGEFQFAELSTTMSTFGRSAAIVGFARKMSVSSLTGSNARATIAPSMMTVTTAVSRCLNPMSSSRVRSVRPLRTIAGQHPHRDPLHDGRPGVGPGIGVARAQVPIRVFRRELAENLGVAARGSGVVASRAVYRDLVLGGRARRGRAAGYAETGGGRRFPHGQRAQDLRQRLLYHRVGLLLLLEIADDLQVDAGYIEGRDREQRQDDQHDERDQQGGAALVLLQGKGGHGISLRPAGLAR